MDINTQQYMTKLIDTQRDRVAFHLFNTSNNLDS